MKDRDFSSILMYNVVYVGLNVGFCLWHSYCIFRGGGENEWHM